MEWRNLETILKTTTEQKLEKAKDCKASVLERFILLLLVTLLGF